MKSTKRRYGKYHIASSSSPDANIDRRPVEIRETTTRTFASLPVPGKPNVTPEMVLNALRDKPYCENCGKKLRWCNTSTDRRKPYDHMWRCEKCRLSYHPEYLYKLYGFRDEVYLSGTIKRPAGPATSSAPKTGT